MRYDFFTADNAERPHSGVTDTQTDTTIAEFYGERAEVRAQAYAYQLNIGQRPLAEIEAEDRELLIKKLEDMALAKLGTYATTSERRSTYNDTDRLEDAMLLLTCVEKLHSRGQPR